MPVMGPSENSGQVERAYQEVKQLMLEKYKLFKMPAINRSGYEEVWHNPDRTWTEERDTRFAVLKESIRKLFELDSWEGW